MICTNVSCRNLDPHNHGDDCDDFCQTCNTPLSQSPLPVDEGWRVIGFMDDRGVTPEGKESSNE